MSDQQTPQPATNAPDADAKEAPQPTASAPELLKALEPYMPLLAEVAKMWGINADTSAKHNTALLVLIIIALCSLAGIALAHDQIDTAEKIIIGLLSFLGGTALFGSTKK